MNLQQRVEACRSTACPTCGAEAGSPCVFTKDVAFVRKGSKMKVHHDERWRATKGWPFGPLELEVFKSQIDYLNAKDSE